LDENKKLQTGAKDAPKQSTDDQGKKWLYDTATNRLKKENLNSSIKEAEFENPDSIAVEGSKIIKESQESINEKEKMFCGIAGNCDVSRMSAVGGVCR